MSIGDRIKDIRKLNKLSQGEFSEKIGIKQSPLSQIENGKILPSIDTLDTIRRVFNISLDWLIGGEEGTEKITSNFTPNDTSNPENAIKKVAPNLASNEAPNSENDIKKMVPNLVPNEVPNPENDIKQTSHIAGEEPLPYIYRGTQPDFEDNADKKIEVILYQNELLEERERTIYALNEVINAQKDALKAQNSLIKEYEAQLSDLETTHKQNRGTAG